MPGARPQFDRESMARSPATVSPPASLRPIARWLLPFGAAAAAVLVVVPLQRIAPGARLLSVFALPAPVVTYLAGGGPGLLTLALMAAASAYLAFPPAFSFALDPVEYSALGVFMIVGIGLWWGARYVRRLESERYEFYDSERRRLAEHAASIRQREERLTSALASEQLARRDSETVAARLAFLAHAGEALASTLDFNQTLANVAAVAVPTFADWCAFDLQRDDGSLERVAVHHRDPTKVDIARELLQKYPPDPKLPRGAYEILRTGRARLFPEITETMMRETSQDDAHFELMRQMGLHSVMIVPLAARGRTIGAISLAWAESRRRYTEEDLAIAVELGRRAALFVDNARLYDREHRIANTLQEAFLPASLPTVPGFSIDVDFVSGSDEANLGGDWYDAFWLPDGRIAFSIGDVMGRGLRAAGFMGLVRQTIRAGAYDRGSAAAILLRANHLLRLGDPTDTATALVAVLDSVASTLTYASAGHPTPLMATLDGDLVSGTTGGPPLGLARVGEPYADHTIALSPGALVVLYTDGLIEYARDPVSGEGRLRETLQHECQEATANPAASIRRRVMGEVERHDDVALLTIRVAPKPLTDLDQTFPAIPGSLPVLRQAIGRFLAACEVDVDRAAALQVAIGEAANNVIEHAYGALRGTLTVRARRIGADVVVEVADHGTWRRSRMDGGGRGLQIMRGLADRVDIDSNAGGTIVRLVLLKLGPTAAQRSNQ